MKFILRSTILPSSMISNLLLLKWRSFQYNTNFRKKILFIDVFIRLLLKTLWKSYFSHHNTKSQEYLHHHVFLYLTFMYLPIPSSLLTEGTPNTWWILLHNDRKSWNHRNKKQCCYESLRCNTSPGIPLGYGKVRQELEGWVSGRTFKNIH